MPKPLNAHMRMLHRHLSDSRRPRALFLNKANPLTANAHNTNMDGSS